MVDEFGFDGAPAPVPGLPFDLRAVLDADPVMKLKWEALPPKQQSDWVTYLAEGNAPARRAIRLANLLMSLED
ncbi:MAG TPA: YdeI/OmpD-associated family protein [Actinomycetota bacterium]|nr:YdeI/OmpD-associated family protein [Actinomycetota bacterium]